MILKAPRSLYSTHELRAWQVDRILGSTLQQPRIRMTECQDFHLVLMLLIRDHTLRTAAQELLNEFTLLANPAQGLAGAEEAVYLFSISCSQSIQQGSHFSPPPLPIAHLFSPSLVSIFPSVFSSCTYNGLSHGIPFICFSILLPQR